MSRFSSCSSPRRWRLPSPPPPAWADDDGLSSVSEHRQLASPGSASPCALGAASPVRWWVIFIFCVASCMQSLSWNFYGPLSDKLKGADGVYHWGDTEVYWAPNVANIAVLFAVPVASLIAPRMGNRRMTVLAAFQVLLCVGLRCILIPLPDLDRKVRFAIIALSFVFNGGASAWWQMAPPLLSHAWFPPTERATATALMSVMPYAGVSLAFIAGPAAVGSHTGDEALHRMNVVYAAEGALGLVALLCILVHFPPRPRRPPAASCLERGAASAGSHSAPLTAASVSEMAGAVGGVLSLRDSTARRLWAVAMAFALPIGVYGAWSAVLNDNLSSLGVSDTDSAILGCAMTLSGCSGAVAVGAVVDRFAGQMKRVAVLSYAASGVGFLVFALAVIPSGPFRSGGRGVLFASALVGGFFVNISIPLFFELAVETVHGSSISESAASGLLIFLVTIVQIGYLVAGAFVSSMGTTWQNWLMAGSCPGVLCFFVFFRAEYPRLAADCGKGFELSRIDRFGLY